MSPAPTWARDPLLEDLEVYRVGGAIRDRLLGLEPGENDFVVVGAAPETMARRGFRAVGRDFPVFLHPHTGEEFALARTERKAAPGYTGFTFHTGTDVGLVDDLERRDLTINAIAEDRAGTLIDPFDGRADLAARVLRHVSDAFVEDPVRLLRLARFASRFEPFSIAPETLALARELVDSGEVDHLVSERIWRELSRALISARPSRFFEVLRQVGALERILPEVNALWGVPQVPEYHPEIDTGVHTMLVLDQSAAMDLPLDARFACLVHDLGKALTPRAEWPRHVDHEQRGLKPVESICQRLKVSRQTRELALLVCELHLLCHRAEALRASTVLKLLYRLDAFRRPARLALFLGACEADKRGRGGQANRRYRPAELLDQAARAARAVDIEPLTERGLSGAKMKQAIDALRREAIASVYKAHASRNQNDVPSAR